MSQSCTGNVFSQKKVFVEEVVFSRKSFARLAQMICARKCFLLRCQQKCLLRLMMIFCATSSNFFCVRFLLLQIAKFMRHPHQKKKHELLLLAAFACVLLLAAFAYVLRNSCCICCNAATFLHVRNKCSNPHQKKEKNVNFCLVAAFA